MCCQRHRERKNINWLAGMEQHTKQACVELGTRVTVVLALQHQKHLHNLHHTIAMMVVQGTTLRR